MSIVEGDIVKIINDIHSQSRYFVIKQKKNGEFLVRDVVHNYYESIEPASSLKKVFVHQAFRLYIVFFQDANQKNEIF